MSGSGLSWAICKSAPSSRHTTMPAPHNSVTFQSIKFQSYQTLQPHMTAYSSARMYSLICVIISNKWDLHSLSYLQGHSRLCVMWYPITSYKSSILTMPPYLVLFLGYYHTNRSYEQFYIVLLMRTLNKTKGYKQHKKVPGEIEWKFTINNCWRLMTVTWHSQYGTSTMHNRQDRNILTVFSTGTLWLLTSVTDIMYTYTQYTTAWNTHCITSQPVLILVSGILALLEANGTAYCVSYLVPIK